jgi:signal transduction histidine kinase
LQEDQFATWVAENEFTNTYIRSLFGSASGDLWITTDMPQQILRLREGFLKVFDVPDARMVRAIAEDIHSNVWMASADGYLMRMGDGVAINETTNDLQRLLPIRSLHATPDGSVWIGYGGSGLGRLKDGKYSRITTAKGLNDDVISAIASDKKGGLWLMGAHGLFRVPLDQMNDIAEGRADHVRSIPYGRAEGVPNLQAYFDSCPDTSLGRDGRLRLAMRTGLAVIHTENLPDNTAPPPVRVDRFVVDGKTLALYNSGFPLRKQETNGALELNGNTTGLLLAPDHKKVEIHFTGLSFSAPENMEFRYKLEHFDDGWNKGGDDRIANYSRLPAGDYTFRVIACNNSGVWNETGATVAFTVAPFVWQTWSFRIVSLVAFTLCVIAIVRYVSFRRLQRRLEIIEKEAAVERERIRIARDIHDDLGDRLTTMSMLSGLVLKGGGNGTEPKHLEQISATARQATDALDEIVWAINPTNDVLPNVVGYIAQFAVEFLRTANISCHVDVPDHPPVKPVRAEVRHNVFLAVKEALTNVARHSGATEVQLRIIVAEKSGTIVTEDNGKGFADAPTASGADGLRNMKHRMIEIGGQCSIESRPGNGTRVTFEFPWLGKS